MQSTLAPRLLPPFCYSKRTLVFARCSAIARVKALSNRMGTRNINTGLWSCHLLVSSKFSYSVVNIYMKVCKFLQDTNNISIWRCVLKPNWSILLLLHRENNERIPIDQKNIYIIYIFIRQDIIFQDIIVIPYKTTKALFA